MQVTRVAAAAVLVASLGASACGRDNTNDGGPTDQLRALAAATRQAAESGDRATAEARLAELRRRVATLRAADDITEERASRILSAAASVENTLDVLPTTTTTPATTAPPEDDERNGERRKGKGGDDDD